MQVGEKKDIPHRSRYYQGLMDTKELPSGSKDYRDLAGFVSIIDHTPSIFVEDSSNRLYVFKEQQEFFDSNIDLSGININVVYRQWDKTFNTPSNEHFARLPILF